MNIAKHGMNQSFKSSHKSYNYPHFRYERAALSWTYNSRHKVIYTIVLLIQVTEE